MSVSRRQFIAEGSALGAFATLLPELAKTPSAAPQASAEEAPHDSYNFWNGFFDSVDPYSANYGKRAGTRGPKDKLPDSAIQTQYLHYKADAKQLRYATDIGKEELLDHEGDVAVSLALAHYRPGSAEKNETASQLRVDTVQIHPMLNLFSPLSWTAIASLAPDKAGNISLESLGFQSPKATQGTSKIVLTGGVGKLAVNISKAPHTSVFVKALKVMISAAKAVAPLVTLPAISVPAMSAFTDVLSYWEDRTKFLMAGNLTGAVATLQAIEDPDRESSFIGLVTGDYMMIPLKHVEELGKELPNLDLIQGHLVRKDADPNLPLQVRAQSAVPNVTYASMRVTVKPLEKSPNQGDSGDDNKDAGGGSSSGSSGKKSDSSGKSKSKGTTKTTETPK